ncbi:MAG: hypothetical protein IJF03_10090 [Lachnospiraceae bacterium]|nr:hypothetical protein [Lachnospiraceae bacterium]
MSETAEKTEKVSTKKETTKYQKESIIKSEKYKNRADILNVLLEDGKTYDLETVDKTIEKFMKGKVK